MNLEKLTELSHYRLFGRSGLRVSPICLGTMTFGTDWGWGADKEESREVFRHYLDSGGNFIDSANFYTGGQSESFIGEFMQDSPGMREQLVLATKFTLSMKRGDPNSGGNHRKNIMQSVEASLRRLQTDYIDLYWLHAWEYRTPVDEVMRALDDLVRSGKVLYVGISDAPAWKVSQANTLADFRGWSPFVGLQIEYSLAARTVERELLPMAAELDIAVTPWSPLCGGLLSGKHRGGQVAAGSRDISKKLTERNLQIVAVVQAVAEEIGKTPAQVSLNWLMSKPVVTSPIIGARTLSQLKDNLGCLDFTLSEGQLARLEKASSIALGFPHDFLAGDFIQDIISGGSVIEK